MYICIYINIQQVLEYIHICLSYLYSIYIVNNILFTINIVQQYTYIARTTSRYTLIYIYIYTHASVL